MRFKLFECFGEYHLLLCTGEIQYLTADKAKDLIINYDSLELDCSQVFPEEFNGYEGKLLAALDNDQHLIIYDADFLKTIATPSEFPYYTAAEYAELHGKSVPIILRHCREERIEGAVNVGSSWFIPKGAAYPRDNRAGRDMSKRNYRKTKNQTK